ncbi:transcription initiation factor IIB [Haloplanus rubicundus]|uniref:Transcription initiation factor IIB n=1 Tax=Haloplanus rubicundus TaxID=1547898 RepID=A0A345E8I8_9EURY|nr:TFIIB-type zinc ribbon-containing protein [Haloplanus rubicundus]AXG08510.1 transcription initiation factor IIB family protein [Haloplanus rubicundus]
MSLRNVYERTFDEDVPAAERSSSGCPECGGLVHTNSIETVCDDCGLVLEDCPIDHGPEWCAFDEAEHIERTRTGPALTPTRHDRGLSSEIGFDQTDANGTTLSGRKRSQIGRLRREHRRGRWSSKAEQNLAHGFSEVRRIVGALDLPRSLRDQACRLYRTAAGEDLIRGRSIEAMAAASVYAACRCAGLPRTLQEVSVTSAVSHEGVQNAYSVLNRELELPTVPMEPLEYVPKVTSALGLSAGTRQRAAALAKQAVRTGVANGYNPAGVAAGCVYQAAREQDERVTQAALADAAEVTPMTVRVRSNELQTVLDGGDDQPRRGNA